MMFYVNISTEEMMHIILSNVAHSIFLKNIDIDVMHIHDDKHPAWSESEISISVLIYSRCFVREKNDVEERCK